MILGIGADVVSISRLAAVVQRSPRFSARVFHPRELDQAADCPERLAVRFAAKEAWLKAMGLGLFSVPLTDVWIENDDTGQPHLMTGLQAGEIMRRRRARASFVSLSHTTDVAMALVVIEGENE